MRKERAYKLVKEFHEKHHVKKGRCEKCGKQYWEGEIFSWDALIHLLYENGYEITERGCPVCGKKIGEE